MRIATFGLGLAALSVMSVSSPANAVVNLVKNGDFSTVTNAVVTTCNSKGKKCSTQTYNNFEFGASFRFDRRLFEDDVVGSLAWARAIAAVGVLSAEIYLK